jgi:Ca2+/H+ antiporter, TMEM165/GDT1 family
MRSRRLYFIPLFFVGIFVFGGVVMLLWNNVLTPVLHVTTVTFWQALGLLVLSKLFFSSFAGGRGGYRRGFYMKQKLMWDQMTPEQKEKFRQEWKDRCRRGGYRYGNDFTEPTAEQGSAF